MLKTVLRDQLESERSVDSAPLMTPGIRFGFICSQIETKFSVDFSDLQTLSEKAASCIVNPAVGDYVACLCDGNKSFIIAVLERNKPESSLDMRSTCSIDLSAPELNLAARNKINLTSQQGNLTFQELNLGVVNFDAHLEKAEARIGMLSYIGKSVKTVLTEVLTRAGTSLRIIDGADYQRSKDIHVEAENLLSIKGKFTSIAAKDDVKIDGSRVHLG
ncbi:MAG: DUF3540 domain-containing protein [Alphaproteobacteria bacterium]|nr:DUF3540 domain-containing protein [Alphaproteobacteria bacterium]